LVHAAFITAVRRKFSPTWNVADIIRFVAAARAERGEGADDIDPRAAEHLIRRALGDRVADGLDQGTKGGGQILLLVTLVEAEQLGDFLVEARVLADQWRLS